MTLLHFGKIHVHCWGGLGSQLHAWVTAEYLKVKFPRKKIVFVFHSSGETRRTPAVNFLQNYYEFRFIDDHVSTRAIDLKKRLFQPRLKKLVKLFLLWTSFLVEANSVIEQKKIKPWTLALRGHYSDVEVSEDMLDRISNQIINFLGLEEGLAGMKEKQLGLHYRLGDLQKLNDKSFIKPNLISTLINRLNQMHEINSIAVYSDDLKSAQNKLVKNLPKSTKFIEAEIWDTISRLIYVEYFVGTNSKISVWITVLRIYLHPNSFSILPISMRDNILKVWPQSIKLPNIQYYSEHSSKNNEITF